MRNFLLIIFFFLMFVAGLFTALFGFALVFEGFQVIPDIVEPLLGISCFIAGLSVMFKVCVYGLDPDTYKRI